MKRLTQRQAAILSAQTGVIYGDVGYFYKYVESILPRPWPVDGCDLWEAVDSEGWDDYEGLNDAASPDYLTDDQAAIIFAYTGRANRLRGAFLPYLSKILGRPATYDDIYSDADFMEELRLLSVHDFKAILPEGE